MFCIASYAAGTCSVSGCYRSTVTGGSYCHLHTCSKSGCTNKADASGYCSKHHDYARDPYDVYDYNDPEDFYFDWEDDFEDFEDAEDYWDSAWNYR